MTGEGVVGEGHGGLPVHHGAEGVEVGVLEGYLSFPAFLVEGLWAAKRRVVPSMPAWHRCVLLTVELAWVVHDWTTSSPCGRTWKMETLGLSSIRGWEPISEGGGLLVGVKEGAGLGGCGQWWCPRVPPPWCPDGQ